MSDLEPFDIPGSVDDVSALPENLRPAYKQHEDGKWRPNIRSTDDWQFRDGSGLMSALEKEKEARRKVVSKLEEAEGRIAKLGDLDLDDVLTTYERARSGKLTGSEEIEQAKTALKRQFDEQMAELEKSKNDEIEALRTDQRARLIDQEALGACAALGAKAKLLLPHIREKCEVRKLDDGSFGAVVLNDRGEPRVSSRDGEVYMSVEEFVSDHMKNDPDFAPAFAKPQGGELRERFGGGGKSSTAGLSFKEIRMRKHRQQAK